MATSEEEIIGHEARFLGLISGLSSNVMQHLGKVVSPLTGKVERNLDAAKEMIEMLRMLKEKTQGNLTDRERRALDALLSSVQLNYLDELKAEAEKPKEKAEEKPPEEEKEEAARPEREGGKARERAEEAAPAQPEEGAAEGEEEMAAEAERQEAAPGKAKPSGREKRKRRERKKSKRPPCDG